MSAFVDTSGVLALLDASDEHHRRADAAWRSLLERDEALVSTSYVLVESFALVQNRLGLEAVQVLHQDVVPLLEVAWVDEEMHRAAVAALLTAARRDLSLVDCTSFECMRRRWIRDAFEFAKHFGEQGFRRVR